MAEKTSNNKSEKARLHVTGMTCTTCARTIGKGLSETHGVKQANVNFASEQASVEYDPTKVDLAKIKDTIQQLGYGVATKKSIFPVSGMTCASCVARVESALSGVPGVVSVSVNLASEKATVEYTEDMRVADLQKAVREAGYELGPEAETLEDVTTASQRDLRAVRNRFIVAIVLGLLIMTLGFIPAVMMQPYMPFILWALASPVQFWAGWRFYRGAWGAL
jgi:Cu+-exporting ATPase